MHGYAPLEIQHNNEIIEINYYYKHAGLDNLDYIMFYPKEKFNKYLLLKMTDAVSLMEFFNDDRTKEHIKTLLYKLTDPNKEENEFGESYNHSWKLCLSPQIV